MSITTARAAMTPPGPARSSTERRGILFIISAPSGTGKTTLCKQLTANIPGLWHSISYTTRAPRPGEEHGREYFFTDEQTFQTMIDRHEFVEWARVYGHLYGTPRKNLADKIDQGIDVLTIIEQAYFVIGAGNEGNHERSADSAAEAGRGEDAGDPANTVLHFHVHVRPQIAGDVG